MRTRKLALACPECGSGKVFYTCTPNCCFNHVCDNCGCTFEPVTKATGQVRPGAIPPDPLPEASDPTVACARCEATAVYVSELGLICAQCGSMLELEITEVARSEPRP